MPIGHFLLDSLLNQTMILGDSVESVTEEDEPNGRRHRKVVNKDEGEDTEKVVFATRVSTWLPVLQSVVLSTNDFMPGTRNELHDPTDARHQAAYIHKKNDPSSIFVAVAPVD